MINKKRISVTVPVYKVEKYLCRCVKSILSQIFTHYELILVDDGSPDNCGRICDEYACEDDRTIVIHKKNGGLSDARNIGIDWSTVCSDSEWISFIDSDDWVHKNYLKLLYETVKTTNLNVAICGFERTNGFVVSEDFDSVEIKVCNTEELYYNNRVNAVVAWGKLFNKNDFINIRFPFGKIHEDEFTTYRILFMYNEVAFIDVPLYYYYTNDCGIMLGAGTRKHMDMEDAYLQQIEFFKEKRLTRLFDASVVFLCDYYIALLNKEELTIVEKKKIAKKVKRLVRRYQIGDNLPFHKNYTYYNFAYPRIMFVYWQLRRIKDVFFHFKQ